VCFCAGFRMPADDGGGGIGKRCQCNRNAAKRQGNPVMIKITTALVGLSLLGTLSIVDASPTLAKAKVKGSAQRPKTSPTYQYDIRRTVQVVRCTHGVWDAYGVRCDWLGPP